MQTLSTDKGTVRAGQKDEASSDLRWLSRTSHRRCELVLLLSVHSSWDEWGPDRAGADTVDTDTVFNLLVGERARKGYDGALGGRVIEEIGAADVGVYRGAGDNGVTALHLREHVFGQVEEGVDVGVEGINPLFPVESVQEI